MAAFIYLFFKIFHAKILSSYLYTLGKIPHPSVQRLIKFYSKRKSMFLQDYVTGIGTLGRHCIK